MMEKHDDSRIFESLSVYPELTDAIARLKNVINTNRCWILKEVQQQNVTAREHVRSN
mgnify:CR=1 FL=1